MDHELASICPASRGNATPSRNIRAFNGAVFGGFASACSSNWRRASERFRACPIDVKLSRAHPGICAPVHPRDPLTKGPMRLRTLTRTATKTRAPRSHNGSQRDRAF
jgi:hypothetical protein